jgi:hypothetical protein
MEPNPPPFASWISNGNTDINKQLKKPAQILFTVKQTLYANWFQYFLQRALPVKHAACRSSLKIIRKLKKLTQREELIHGFVQGLF